MCIANLSHLKFSSAFLILILLSHGCLLSVNIYMLLSGPVLLKCTLCQTKIHRPEIFLSPELEVTWCTVAIIIRVILLSPYLCIRGVSLSSIHGWKRRVGNCQKLKNDLTVTIQSLTLSWVEAESLYRSVLTVSRHNPSSWTCASSSLQK